MCPVSDIGGRIGVSPWVDPRVDCLSTLTTWVWPGSQGVLTPSGTSRAQTARPDPFFRARQWPSRVRPEADLTRQTPSQGSRRLPVRSEPGVDGLGMDNGPGRKAKLLLERCESGRIGLTVNQQQAVDYRCASPAGPPTCGSVQGSRGSTEPVSGFMDRIIDDDTRMDSGLRVSRSLSNPSEQHHRERRRVRTSLSSRVDGCAQRRGPHNLERQANPQLDTLRSTEPASTAGW